MRFGLFLALVIPLAVIAAVTVPVPAPNDFPRRGVGQAVESFRTPVCYQLSYDSAHTRKWIPRWMRLTDSGAQELSEPGWPAYRATSGERFPFGAWRMAGADSIDLQWNYDSPILRLPTRGDTLTGRGGWREAANLLDALVNRGFTVRAVRVSCGASIQELACPSSWHQALTADLSMALCIPSALQRRRVSDDEAIWERSDATSPEHVWLSIDVNADPATEDPWPPHLAGRSSCLVDCVTVDSVVQHVDTLAGSVVQVETGLVSGGEPGLRRQPSLTAGWTTPTASRVWVFGLAAHGATLDTLRAALRTLTVIVP